MTGTFSQKSRITRFWSTRYSIGDDDYLTFQISERAERKLKKAMDDYHSGKAVKADDISN